PFSVTSPNGGGTIAAGSNTTVTWNVNGTGAFCNNVNIRLSTDGGLNFPYTLLATTPNDGSQSVSIPAGVPNTTTARIMVECADNTCVVFFDISDGNFTITSDCNAAGSNICPATPVSFPAGDGGLNLGLSGYFGSVVTSNTFTINAGSPTGPLANATVEGGTICQTAGANRKYATFDFAVSATGSYTFLNTTSSEDIIYSVFVSSGYNPASPCAGTFVESNSWAAYAWNTLATMTLNACSVYKMVVWNWNANDVTPTITMSGPGTFYSAGSGPGGNYSYTYAAVNTANSQVAAVSATSDFTALAAGSYLVYGASYYSGAGPNPPTVNPATWVGQTLSAILSGGSCVVFSANFKSVTVTGGGGGTPVISISGSPSQNEGNDGTTAFNFTASRTGSIASASSASWAVTGSGGNPANAADFGGTLPSGTVTFPAGSSASQTIVVNVSGDTDVESNEGFTVTLSNPTNATIGTATASGTILNDDAAPAYCTAGATATTDEKISNVLFNTINNGSASTAGYEDFTAVSTSVAQGATHNFTGTISNSFASDEIIVWIDFNQDFDFADAGEEVFNSPNGTGPHSGNITIPANATTGATRMRVRLHDTANGPNATPCGNSDYGQVEDYTINITASGGTPSIAISGNPSQNEGNSGTTAFNFTVTRTGNTANASSASWAVTGTGGNPANAADFGGTLPSGTVTFPAGSSATQTIVVNVSGDTGVESDEGFTVTLSNPTNATLGTATASGTILNDDTAPAYCTAGATNTGFEKLSNVLFNTINNGSASTAGYEDFTAVSTSVAQGATHNFTGTIAGGFPEDEIIVWIDLNQDLDFADAGEEVFNSPTGAGPHSGNVTIPANATLGATRMRVRLHDTANNPNATPCGTSDYGQVEDYTINITAGGPAGASLDFDGTDDHVTLPANLTASLTDFTFEAWVFWDGSSNWQRVFDFGSNTTVYMHLTPSSSINSSRPMFAITTGSNGAEQRIHSSVAAAIGQWQHYAVVIDDAANTGVLYLDGVQVGSNTSMTLTPAALGNLANNYLGRSQWADPYFNGKLDEVRIWNLAKTSQQVHCEMDVTLVGNEAGLAAYYNF
ncbi:MAG: GEVED domain-containing protein, partial [Bacteroidota bacterium]